MTLRRREEGELRGCIGFLEGGRSLAEAVRLAAAAAATEDARFDPVSPDELASCGWRSPWSASSRRCRRTPSRSEPTAWWSAARRPRGLLLPQVAAERGWDRETFLDQTCHKAGLAAGSWREPGAEVLAFTAVVFGEA